MNMSTKRNRDFSFAKDLVCSICMHPYNDKERLPVTLLCPHIYWYYVFHLFLRNINFIWVHSKECVSSFSVLSCPDCNATFSPCDVIVNRDIIRCLHLAEVAALAVSHKKDAILSNTVSTGKKDGISSGSDSMNTIERYQATSTSSEPSTIQAVDHTGSLPAPPPLKSSTSTTSLDTKEAPSCQFCKESPVEAVCHDCNDITNLCQDCFAFRHRKGSMKSHTSVPWMPNLGTIICAEHQQACLMFCKRDNMAICKMCTLADHRDHEVYVMSDEAEEYRRCLDIAVLDLERISREVQEISAAIIVRYEEIVGEPVSAPGLSGGGAVVHSGQEGAPTAVVSATITVDTQCVSQEYEGCGGGDLTGCKGCATQCTDAIMSPKHQTGGGTAACDSPTTSNGDCSSESTGATIDINAPRSRDASSEVAIRAIDNHFDGLKGMIDARRKELVGQVQALRQEKADMLIAQLDHLAMYAARNYAVCFRVKHCLKSQPSAYLFQYQNKMMTSVTKQVEKYRSIARVPAATDDIQFTPTVTSTEYGGVDVGAFIGDIGRIISNDVDPKLTIVIGEALLRAVTLNKEVKLTVLMQDRQGLRITTGGDGVTCVVKEHSGGLSVEDAVRVFDNGDGSYSIIIKCTSQGDFRLRIFVRGVEIGMSPLDYHVSSSLRNGTIGEEGTGPGQLLNPQGLCCYDGMLYVSDQGNCRVQVFGCDGSYVWSIGSWGRGRRQLQSVNGVCLNDGLLFVSDSHNHRVHVFDPEGTYVRHVGSRGVGPGQLQCPQGICCNMNTLYVSDSANNRIQAFDCDGTFLRSIGAMGRLQNPTGICCDNDLLYVCDSDNDRVQVFHCDGRFSKSIGGWGSGPGQMLDPSAVCYYDGLLLVCDRGNHRVLVFNRDGTFLRSVANWRRDCDDGCIPLPQGICCYDGLVYLSDVSDHRIYVLNTA